MDLASLTFAASELPAKLPRLIEGYHQHGAVLVKDLIPRETIDDLKQDIVEMCKARMKTAGQDISSLTDLDDAFNAVCNHDRAMAGKIYSTVKTTLGYYRLVHSKPLVDLVQKILSTTAVQFVLDLSLFRIDRPGEHKFSFDWHQDYQYNMMSRSAVTAWIPLTDIEPDMGRLGVCFDSHRSIRPIRIEMPEFKAGAGGGGRALSLANENFDELERQCIEVPVKAGDALIFTSLTLHRSGHNQSNGKARWVANPRYGDLLDSEVVKRDWRTATRQEFVHVFKEFHPELVTEATAPNAQAVAQPAR